MRLAGANTLGAALALVGLAAAAAGCGSSGPMTSAGPPKHRHAGAGGRPAAPRFHPLVVPSHAPARTVRVPILTYHRVVRYASELTKSQPDLTVEPDTFTAEMTALERGGYTTITQRQLFAALYRGAGLPRRPVIVSVDDGYVDDVNQVLPVLRRLHMTATFYVITGRTHEPGFLSPAQIRELDAAGMDVGAHTRTHASLPQLAPAGLDSEVAGSRRDLERILGHPVYWFAYPYGAFDARVVRAVRRAGFLLAVTTEGGTAISTTAPLTIPRIHVGRTATARSVLALAGGG
jgi:peptidoglycan/xylan/chitin deacetylase (PgdA/CDA1 family)